MKLRSKLEERVWDQLLKTKVPFDYEEMPVVYEKIYWPDFYVKVAVPYILEVKGYFCSEDRSKMLAVKKANPTLDIRMLFGRDNKISKNGMLYSQWCDKYGFPWAIGEIPERWLE